MDNPSNRRSAFSAACRTAFALASPCMGVRPETKGVFLEKVQEKQGIA